MQFDFRFRPGQAVVVGTGGSVYIVQRACIDVTGEKTYRLVDGTGQSIPNHKNAFEHKESDLRHLGAEPGQPMPSHTFTADDVLAPEVLRHYAAMCRDACVNAAYCDSIEQKADLFDAWPNHFTPG